MKASQFAPLAVCAGALALAACATGTPAAAAKQQPKVVYTVADAKTEAKIPDGYTLIKRNGTEFYCHNESVTGSHTQKKQICQTKEQMEAERNGTINTVDYASGR